jgi:hypothetical protein
MVAKLFQQHWQYRKGKYELNFAFEMPTVCTVEQKRTGGQFHYIAPLTSYANLCSHLPEEICLFK